MMIVVMTMLGGECCLVCNLMLGWICVWSNGICFFQAEDGIRDAQESRGLGDVYKRQEQATSTGTA